MKRIAAAAVTIVTALAVLTPAAAHARGPEIGGQGSHFYLNDEWSGTANIDFEFGDRTDRAYVGDWNGSGRDTLAIRRGSTFYLTNSSVAQSIDVVFAYGKAADTTLVGDWNGDGIDTLAVRRGNVYYFTNALRGGAAEAVIGYGKPGDEVLVGDWDGNATDTLAVRRGSTFYFSNSLRSGAADITVAYGRAGDHVYTGDWDGDGVDTPVVRRASTYYVKNSFSGGDADQVLTYGRADDSTLVGDWNADGRDTLGVRRVEPSASQAWADRTYGTFAPRTYSGSGFAQVALPAGARAGIITISYSGGGNIQIQTVKSAPRLYESSELVLRTSRAYSGSRAFGLYHVPVTPDTIVVDGTGSWKITVSPLGSATEMPRSGTGDRVYLYSGASGSTFVDAPDSSGPFVADQFHGSTAEGLSVNTTFDQSAVYDWYQLAGGPSAIIIESPGKWSFTLPE